MHEHYVYAKVVHDGQEHLDLRPEDLMPFIVIQISLTEANIVVRREQRLVEILSRILIAKP